MHDGIKIKLGEREVTMPKLTAGGLKRHWPKFRQLSKRVAELRGEGDAGVDGLLDAAPELLTAQIALVHAALKRNYKDMTLEEVEDGLELPDVKHVFASLLVLSNLERKTSEDAAPGEVESPKS